MAKPPPVEYFNIHIGRVPKEHLGETMSALAKLGLTDVRPELITELVRFNQRAPAGDNYETLKEWVIDHPTFKANEFADHLGEIGRTKTSAYHALSRAVDDKLLKKVGVGQYVRKDAFLPGSKKPKKAAKQKDGGQRYKIPHTIFALDYAAKHGGKFNRIDLANAMKKANRPSASISSVLRDLMKSSRIERVEEGVYAVLKQSKANGAGAAHG